MNRSTVLKLLPIMLAFGVMGFIDIVGVATSYVKEQYSLSDSIANLLPSMAMIWFVLISLPTSVLMGKIGRKNTVLLSLLIMTVAMPVCFIGNSFPAILLSFALLGIGNTILQVSINPLLNNILDSRHITSAITFGQFVKAIVSFLGPILISYAASKFSDWRFVFIAYTIASLLAFLWLAMTPIEREKISSETSGNSIGKIFAMLRQPYLLVCFTMILFVVGFEISLMTAIPKYLKEACDVPLEKGSLGCSIFYAAKTVAAFAGTFILAKMSPRKYLTISLVILLASFVWFMAIENVWSMAVSIVVIGLAIANVFSVVLSMAMKHSPEYANEISALMITGIAGGALLPPVVGVVADMASQRISLFVPLAVLLYMLFAAVKWMKK